MESRHDDVYNSDLLVPEFVHSCANENHSIKLPAHSYLLDRRGRIRVCKILS